MRCSQRLPVLNVLETTDLRFAPMGVLMILARAAAKQASTLASTWPPCRASPAKCARWRGRGRSPRSDLSGAAELATDDVALVGGGSAGGVGAYVRGIGNIGTPQCVLFVGTEISDCVETFEIASFLKGEGLNGVPYGISRLSRGLRGPPCAPERGEPGCGRVVFRAASRPRRGRRGSASSSEALRGRSRLTEAEDYSPRASVSTMTSLRMFPARTSQVGRTAIRSRHLPRP